jgi:hypothetical protein
MGTFLALRQARFCHAERWPNQGSGSGICRTDIRLRAFERKRPCASCSVIQVCGSCALIGAQKNGLRLLRAGPDGLVRPAGATGSRPVECRIPNCSELRAFRAKTAARRAPPPSLPLPPPIDRKAIVLGRNQETSVPIVLSERARLEHAHVIGTTGGGKTKFLEACIRQDIRAGRGVCVVDPHGDHPDSLYRSVLGWLDRYGYTAGGRNARPIHLIDPNAPTHTVGFNPDRMRQLTFRSLPA